MTMWVEGDGTARVRNQSEICRQDLTKQLSLFLPPMLLQYLPPVHHGKPSGQPPVGHGLQNEHYYIRLREPCSCNSG